ncbi:MAG: fatty acid desaturase, partial [Vicinamibacterales bacterium]
MAPADAAPGPADLTHLRPSDAAGLRVVGLALAGTTLALLLSFAGGWGLWLPGQILLGVMLVQWFVILHECGHDTLFRTRRWHAIAGRVAAAFSLIPYHCWTRVHGRHHKWTGWQDLDPTTESLTPRPRGRGQRAIVNLCWRFWIPLFSVAYRVTNYWNVARLFRMFPRAADRWAIARDTAVLVALYGLVIAALGFALTLRGFGLALVISLVIEDLLLLSQHTHVPQHVSGGGRVKPF